MPGKPLRPLRILRHLLVPDWWVRRAFPAALVARIEAAVAASERRHRGELRIVAEAGLPLASLLGGERGNQGAGQATDAVRARAIDLFAALRVWDTAGNSGVLIYLQLVDRRVEIVADRGIDACVGSAFWRDVCVPLETALHAGDFEGGLLAAIERIEAALIAHFPARADNPNELPDRPLVL